MFGRFMSSDGMWDDLENLRGKLSELNRQRLLRPSLFDNSMGFERGSCFIHGVKTVAKDSEGLSAI
jgi:hypothetical protein